MKTVLIIDDDEACREVLRTALAQAGWHVHEAGQGEQGIELARLHRPDVVLCDLLMPRCNGFRVCRELRASNELRGLKIIVTSGRKYPADQRAAQEAGADEYLPKPIDTDRLLDLLARLDHGGPQKSPGRGPALCLGPARLKFWGVRGSTPTPGAGTVQYGGNTSCVEVRAGGEIIILDGGSGLRPLGRQLLEEFGDQPLNLTLLLTHTHWDHIQGIPFFRPIYQPQNRLRILGYEGARHGLGAVLSSQMESPVFPVALREVPANLEIVELKEMNFNVGRVRVEASFANHPGICVGYRLYTPEGSVAYFPDNELPHAADNPAADEPSRAYARDAEQKIIEFLRNTDVLIMDSQYDREEYQQHTGWGHACLDDVVALALKAGVKKLFLFHHDPDHDDQKVAEMAGHAHELVRQARGTLEVEAAREGAVVMLTAASTR